MDAGNGLNTIKPLWERNGVLSFLCGRLYTEIKTRCKASVRFLWKCVCALVNQGQLQEAKVKSVRGNIYEWTFTLL